MVKVSLGPAADRVAAYGAAHAMTHRAYAALAREGKDTVVCLWPKPGRGGRPAMDARALERACRLEYENQLHRWEIARNNESVRAQIARRMLDLAGGVRGEGGVRVVERLAPEQEAAIERLLEEAGKGPKDPLGIATPWGGAK
ncbi:MAG: hypothetical protein ABII00_02430 [Elusimicrobiota bacterium]